MASYPAFTTTRRIRLLREATHRGAHASGELGNFGVDMCRELLGCSADDLEPHFIELSGSIRTANYIIDLAGKSNCDRRWEVGRTHESIPAMTLKLSRSSNSDIAGGVAFATRGEWVGRVVTSVRSVPSLTCGMAVEALSNKTSKRGRRRHRLPRAPGLCRGHAKIDTGRNLEQFPGQVCCSTRPMRCEGQLTGLGFGHRNQFGADLVGGDEGTISTKPEA